MVPLTFVQRSTVYIAASVLVLGPKYTSLIGTFHVLPLTKDFRFVIKFVSDRGPDTVLQISFFWAPFIQLLLYLFFSFGIFTFFQINISLSCFMRFFSRF